MAILESSDDKIKIYLKSPNGQAFGLIHQAGIFSKQLGLDGHDIRTQMISGDYENMIQVFDKYFGNVCDLIRD